MAEEHEFEDEERPDDTFQNPLEGDELPEGEEGGLEEREVKVAGVFEHKDQNGIQASAFIVLLRDSMGRSVPIWIGKFEALAISLALEGASADRPITHDLLNNVIVRMGGTVDRILIDDLWNNTYYAKVSITYDSKQLDVDSRPSDAIALGLRAKAPIYMAENVLRKAGVKEE